MIGLAEAEREAERDGFADPADDGFGEAIRIREKRGLFHASCDPST
jgi:hypothetical protein